MKSKNKILLGSISVNYEIWLPYASGCLQSYACADPLIESQYTFFNPIYKTLRKEELIAALQNVDILGLTCYVWNQSINNEIAAQFKLINKNGTVLYGGPNVPKELGLQEEMARNLNFVDYFFVGPGEETFTNFLRTLSSAPKTNHAGTFGVYKKQFFSNGTDVRRQIDTTQLPDPYNDLVFQKILLKEKKVKCSFETNRGCPFSCSFCDWGGTSNSRVTKFDVTKIKKVLDYIYCQSNVSEIEILDANFGMHQNDLDIVDYMVSLKNKHLTSPKVSYSGLVKNGSKYLTPILQKIHFELGAEQRNLKISFQTHSKETLRVAQRANIRNEKLLPIIDQLRADGLSVTSEMIIALPGETPQSWLETLQKDYELKINFMRTYFLQVTLNTDIHSAQYREMYNIKTKTLRFPNNFSGLSYKNVWQNEQPSEINFVGAEETEMMYSCHSFNHNDAIEMFDYWWFYHNLLNSRALKSVVDTLCKNGISLATLIKSFFEWLPRQGLLALLVEKNRKLIRRLYLPERTTNVSTLSEYFFYHRCLRQDDVYQLWLNQDIFFTEIDGFVALWINDLHKRQDLLKSQQHFWEETKTHPLEWVDVKKFFGTDARILKKEYL